jgi:hypothetical protein
MKRSPVVVALLSLVSLAFPSASAAPPRRWNLVNGPADREAIQQLLTTYTTAVSTKNERLFETILFDKMISFSFASDTLAASGYPHGIRNYEDFRKGVFEGAPFTQTFHDVDIRQDGPLATVTLIFVNTSSTGTGWGWKSLQLLKVNGAWKIASEFFTGHA